MLLLVALLEIDAFGTRNQQNRLKSKKEINCQFVCSTGRNKICFRIHTLLSFRTFGDLQEVYFQCTPLESRYVLTTRIANESKYISRVR